MDSFVEVLFVDGPEFCVRARDGVQSVGAHVIPDGGEHLFQMPHSSGEVR